MKLVLCYNIVMVIVRRKIRLTMLYVVLFLVMFGVGFVVAKSTDIDASALNTKDLIEFSQNNILFYDPGDRSGDSCNSSLGYSGDEVTFADLDGLGINDRLKLLVKTYGQYAMDLQKYYGVPWEIPFAIMIFESGIGTGDGVNKKIEQAGYYNFMGLTDGYGVDHYKSASYAGYYVQSTGLTFAGYNSISKMLLGYFIYHARNGINPDFAYDKGLKLLAPNNYRLEEAIPALMYSYCGSAEEGGYCAVGEGIIDIIRPGGNTSYTGLLEVVESYGWKNSEELAKSENIKPGGIATEKWGWGDIRQQIWDAYGRAGLPSGNFVYNLSGENYGEGNPISEKAKEYAWGLDESHEISEPNTDYSQAAERLDGGFVGNVGCNGDASCYPSARFVSLVIYESNVDTKFNQETREAGNMPHMLGDAADGLSTYLVNSDKWEKVTGYDGLGYDKLLPGDVLIYDPESGLENGVDNGSASAFIYVGGGIVAESRGDYAPYQHRWNLGKNGGHVAFRLKDAGVNDDGDYCDNRSSADLTDFDRVILNYAWDTFAYNNCTAIDVGNGIYSSGCRITKPSYTELVNSGAYYNGGGGYPETDCNGFVTKMVIVTGIDPNYNANHYYTVPLTADLLSGQGWASNWYVFRQRYTPLDTSTLRKGDVFLKDNSDGRPGHTFFYVGEIEGFQCNIASASLGMWTPRACNGEGGNAENYAASNSPYYVFRRK